MVKSRIKSFLAGLSFMLIHLIWLRLDVFAIIAEIFIPIIQFSCSVTTVVFAVNFIVIICEHDSIKLVYVNKMNIFQNEIMFHG